MSVLVAVNEIIIEDVIRRNGEYVRRAIQAWDSYGEGEFYRFVAAHVATCWMGMVALN